MAEQELFDFSRTVELDDDEIAESVSEVSPKLDCEPAPVEPATISGPELDKIVAAPETPRNGNQQEPEQVVLFEKGEAWENLWKGMPEYIQKDQEPFKTIYVHFETRKDMESFAELVKQRIGLNTKSIWFPEAEIGHFAGKCYVAPEDDSVEVIEDE